MYYIYILLNKINNKIYVGQTNNLVKRKREHKAKDRLHTKATPIYHAINKYGFENFSMIEIESFDDPNLCDIAEQYWILFFQSKNRKFGYNIADGGKVNRGFKHTEKFKYKKSRQMKDFYKNNKVWNAKLSNDDVDQIRLLFLSASYSMRELAKMFDIDRTSISDIIRNKSYKNTNYNISDEDIKNISKQNLNRKRYKIKIRDEFGNIFPSIMAAAEHYQVSEDAIAYRLKNKNIRKSKYNLPAFSKI